MPPKKAFGVIAKILLLSGLFVFVVFAFTTPALVSYPITSLINAYKNLISPPTTQVVVPTKPGLVPVNKTSTSPVVVVGNSASNLSISDSIVLSILERLIGRSDILNKIRGPIGPRGPTGPSGLAGLQGSGSSQNYLAYTFPSTDGMAGQVLHTNGAGTLIWGYTGGGGGGGGGGLSSVTVDGVTITGNGTSGSPLTASLASYLSLSGGIMAGEITIPDTTSGVRFGWYKLIPAPLNNGMTLRYTAASPAPYDFMKFTDTNGLEMWDGNTLGQPKTVQLYANGNIVSYGTEANRMPVGNDAQRPASPTNGDYRYNTTASAVEYYDGHWQSVATTAALSSGYVPFTGATSSLVMGAQDVSANSFTLSDTSGKTIFGNGAGAVNTATDLTAFGKSAAASNTTGNDNVAIGYQALMTATTAHANTAVGWTALKNVTSNGNTAVGSDALATVTTGEWSTAVGTHALNLSTASYNDAFGYNSLGANTTGTGNAAFGISSLALNVGGGQNTALGASTLGNNTSGGSNTAVGYNAMVSNLTASFNVAVGQRALGTSQTGDSNIAIGYYALNLANGATANTAVGESALGSQVTGNTNVAIGWRAMMNHTAGASNVAIGDRAGYTNDTGTFNVFLGPLSGYYETGSSKLFIDNTNRASEADGRAKALIYGVFDAVVANQFVTINGGLNVKYTQTIINADSSALTDLLINPTVKASGNLINAQVGSVNKFSVGVDGNFVSNVASAVKSEIGRLEINGSYFAFGNANANSSEGQLKFTSDASMVWSSTTALAGARDLGLARSAAGVIKVTDGSTGYGSIESSSFVLTDTSGKTIFGNGAGAANTNTDLTAFGKSAAAVNSDTGVAVGNTAIGYEAMKTNISGHLNVALGYQSLKASLGSGNVALGGDTLTALTTGEHVTAVGAHALKSITTANGNDAFGYAALMANTTGSNNLAFGVQALENNIDGDENIAIGFQALVSQTSGGYYNIAIGPRALAANIDADYNLAIGRNSLTSLQTGNMNSAIGYGTLTAINGGYYQNTAVGAQALGAKTAGSENTAVGAKAGFSDLTGVQNTVVGNQAGYTMTAGSRNVFLGNYAGYYETGSDKLFIDNLTRASEADGRVKALVYGVFNAAVASQSLTINGVFNAAYTSTFGVGATTSALTDILVNPAVKASGNLIDLQVASATQFSVTNAGVVQQKGCTTAGALYADVSGNIICNPSKAQFKNNIVDLTYGLSSILALRPVSYAFNPDMNMGSGTYFGFVSGEVAAVAPEFATHDKDGNPYGLDTNAILATTVKAIQEMNLNIEGIAGITVPLPGSPSESFVTAFYNKMIAWLGEAGNGIGDFFANRAHLKELCVAKSDGTEFCANGDQLDAMLTGTATGSGSGGGVIIPPPLPVIEPTPILKEKEPVLPAPVPTSTIPEPTPEPTPTPPAPAPVIDPVPVPVL